MDDRPFPGAGGGLGWLPASLGEHFGGEDRGLKEVVGIGPIGPGLLIPWWTRLDPLLRTERNGTPRPGSGCGVEGEAVASDADGFQEHRVWAVSLEVLVSRVSACQGSAPGHSLLKG